MQNFSYYAPTEVIFGADALKKLGFEIKKNGFKTVLVIYGSDRIEKSGLLGQVISEIEKGGAMANTIGGVKANPRLSHVKKILEAFKDSQPDLVLAIGGGSAIDTAKAVALGFGEETTDVWPYWAKEKTPSKAIPVAAVLTIPAAGSEMSDSAVLTNEETRQKKGLSTDLYRPRFAIMDPKLAASLPPYQVACGITDIMMHTLERYFAAQEGANELTDAIAEALLKTVIQSGPAAYADPSDIDAMSEIMWAGSLSHNNLTGLGRNKDFSVHQFGHELSARYDIAHGASLSALWDSFARHTMKADPSRYARYARNVWGIEEADDEAAALAGIAATEAFFRSLDMPTSLSAVKEIGYLDEDTLHGMAEGVTWKGLRTIGTFCPLDTEGVYEVFRIANDK